MATDAQGGNIGLSDAFFPPPSRNPDPIAPRTWPGTSAEASQTLSNLLRQNNGHWHIYFDDRGFHNHLTHHLFATYALGAKASLLNAAYDHHVGYQKPAYKSPGPITSATWRDHLGDPDFYNAYMHFYASEIQLIGAPQTLEKYIFHENANLTSEGHLGPQMVNRLVGGLLHPLIHVGHWAEFGVSGMLAEGLAMASTTSPGSPQLFPPDFFQLNDAGATSIGKSVGSKQGSHEVGLHCFDILERILQDPELEAGKTCGYTDDAKFSKTVEKAGHRIRSYARLWTVSKNSVPAKLEELAWLATLIFGLGGFRKGHAFRCDFFLLHLVTSTLFVPTLVTGLSFRAQSTLLRAQLSVILAYWISRGRPSLPIGDFYNTFEAQELIPKALDVVPGKDAIGVDKNTLAANLWLPIVESALNHPEEHLIKVQRSLAHFDALYGGTSKGRFATTNLRGAELLDGAIFWRIGLETQKAMGWVREGEPQGKFSRAGLGWDEGWEDDEEKHGEYGF